MSLSAAIGQVAGLLVDIERDDQTVRDISLTNETEPDGAITGEACVCVPVLQTADSASGVTISPSDVRLDDGYIEVSLDISVNRSALDSAGSPATSAVADHEPERTVPSSGDGPAYKDPDALETVYDEFDTFPEMTRALGVDVTSETVRRYMVKHGIHAPDDSGDATDSIAADADARNGDAEAASDPTAPTDDATWGGETDAATASATDGVSTPSDGTGTDPESDEDATAAVDLEAGPPSERGSSAGGEPESELESRSVAELLQNTDPDDGEIILTDGGAIPQSLTVGELAKILEQSRTVREATQELGLGYELTRRILHELGLIELVTGRLASSYTEVPPKLVAQRLTGVADPSV